MYERGSVTVQAPILVPAIEFWRVLRDWPAILSWVLPPESPPPPVVVQLKDGHDVATLPCTRVLEFDPPLGFPYEETLLYAYQDALRIYYTFNGIPNGLCNYMATTYIDATGESSATVTCASTFDLPITESMPAMKQYLADVYEHMIIRGIEAAVKAQAPSS